MDSHTNIESSDQLLSFIKIDDKFNVNLPLKVSEIHSNAIYFGTTKIIKTNNSLTLSEKGEIIFDVRNNTIVIPDLETKRINKIMFEPNNNTKIPGTVYFDKITFNVHPDHFISFDDGICLKAKTSVLRFTDKKLSTDNIESSTIKVENAKIDFIESINTNSCITKSLTSTSLLSDSITIGSITISKGVVKSSELITFSESKIDFLHSKKITLKGSFRTFINTIELQDDRALKLTSPNEIFFNSNKITNSGLVVKSNSKTADVGTVRYNPDIDNIEYMSNKGLVSLNHEKELNELREMVRILSVEISELKQNLQHIKTHNTK